MPDDAVSLRAEVTPTGYIVTAYGGAIVVRCPDYATALHWLARWSPEAEPRD